MLLREFVYFTEKDKDLQTNKRYSSSEDKSILGIEDTRKTRLTLKAINKLRIAGEAREQEAMEDLVLIRAMYAAPPPEQTPML